MRRFNDPLPPVQRLGGLVGCWVRDGPWGDHYYAGALLPDGGPCLVRARVQIDSAVDRAVPYRLAEWVVFAGDDVWAWERCWAPHPDSAYGLRDVERLVGERGIRWQGGGPGTA